MKDIKKYLKNEYKKNQLSEIMKILNIEEIENKPKKRFLALSVSFICTSFILLIISVLIYINSKITIPQYSEIEMFLKENTDKYFANPISVTVIEEDNSYSFLNIYYGIKDNKGVYFFEFKSNHEESAQMDIEIIANSGIGSDSNNQLVINIKLDTDNIKKYEGSSLQLNITIKNQNINIDVDKYFKYLIEITE